MGNRAPRGRNYAKEAAIEKALSRYVRLACGHFTDIPTMQVYEMPEDPKGFTFCELESCEGMREVIKAKRNRIPLPETPPF